MADVFFSDHVKKSKKPHQCDYCLAIIPAGSSCLSEHGIYDGYAFRRYCCNECEPIIDDFWEYVDHESCDIVADFAEYCFVHGESQESE